VCPCILVLVYRNLRLAERKPAHYFLVNLRHILECERPDDDFIALPIALLQVTGGAEADKLAINHDGNFVAERFRFIHSVSGKKDRGVLKLL